jgi:hypothetical protein
MKRTFLIPILAAIIPIVFMGVYFLTVPVEAQGTCDVNQVNFRSHKPSGADFYEQDDRPIVYFDVQTADCIGQTIKVSLVGEFLDSPDNVDDIDERSIAIGANTDNLSTFTIAARAGEEGCSEANSPECSYPFIAENEGGTLIFTSSTMLNYACDGICDWAGENWEFLDLIPYGNDFGGPNGLDPYGPGNTTGNTYVPPQPPQPDDPDGPSVIALDIENPLAGTIGTIPEFLHKILDFVIKIAIPLIAMAIVVSGFLFVTARGEPAQIENAKNFLKFAIIGGLILLASWLVAEAIKEALLSI